MVRMSMPIIFYVKKILPYLADHIWYILLGIFGLFEKNLNILNNFISASVLNWSMSGSLLLAALFQGSTLLMEHTTGEYYQRLFQMSSFPIDIFYIFVKLLLNNSREEVFCIFQVQAASSKVKITHSCRSFVCFLLRKNSQKT
jgi:hypothetical protein